MFLVMVQAMIPRTSDLELVRAALKRSRVVALLGPRRAETVRQLARRSYRHAQPGAEWPHSYGGRDIRAVSFWERAARLDGGQP